MKRTVGDTDDAGDRPAEFVLAEGDKSAKKSGPKVVHFVSSPGRSALKYSDEVRCNCCAAMCAARV